MIKEEQIYDPSNVYLAYLRVKNNIQNEELIFAQEIAYFEKDLERNLKEIKKNLKNKKYKFEKFDYVLKFKKISKNEISYRPLVRFRFFDLVLMQSVFNVVCDSLKNFLPSENYGVQLSEENSQYLYKNWLSQYKKFTNQQKENLSENTVFQYSYEYDIAQFFPSVQQQHLINQLKDCLKINEESLTYFWIEKIIKHFCEDNISDETKPLFKEYFKNMKDILGDEVAKNYRNDLGLPQGPLYSAFLASFYTKDLLKKIRKGVKDNWDIDCEIFSYVDDGRIYFKDYISEHDKEVEKDTKEHSNRDSNINVEKYKGIKTIVCEALKSINNEKINKKVINLNDEKSCLNAIDEKSIVLKLKYLENESSLVNNSINPNFDVEQDTVEAVLQRHENIKKSINLMYSKLKFGESNQDSEINKLKKTYSTYTKRKASFLTRKISSSEKFYELVNLIFSEYNSKDDELSANLCDLNYYYALCNMLKNAEKNSYKINYLCDKIEKMLESYEILVKNKEIMLYYYLTTIKAIHSINYTNRLAELIDMCISKMNNNKLLNKSKYSYNSETWFQYTKITNEIFNDTADIDMEERAIIYYLNYPFELFNPKNWLLDFYVPTYKENRDQTKYSIVKKYKSLTDNNTKWNHEIIIHNLNCELKDEVTSYIRLDDINLDLYTKIKILYHLVAYWKDELTFNKYIKPAYMILDNIYIKSNCNEIHIIDNTSNFFTEYHLYKFGITYKKYFLEFFMKLFNCEENIIVNKKGRALKFWEYRILAYLYNKGFEKKEFLEMLTDLLKRHDYFNHDVDINYERIRTIVDSKLKTSFDKDVIIQLHYFVQCIWKNGSKDLTFYTLHNQEHSVELIQNYLNINKRMLSKLSLNKYETYILFAACYLHDIGMLKGLTDKEKYNISNPKIIKYYCDALKHSNITSSIKIENALNKLFEINNLTSNLIEEIVRGEHALRSAIEIQNDSNLPLSDLEKKYISEVSCNHMKGRNDVYGTQNRQLFRKVNIDIRKISMWLRLLDLTDITKYRVTQEVFDRYFDRMGITSRFHWVKHLCIDDLKIRVEHEKNDKSDVNLGKINVIIQVIMNYIPSNEIIQKNCNEDCECHKFSEKKDGHDNPQAKIYCRNVKATKKKYCDLQCAFFNEFKYFDDELEAINNYAKLYQEEIGFKIEYILNKETERDDFVVLTNYNDKKITATECIRQYFNS